MMNGAITLGTMDGANIEIAQFAGKENCVTFGLSSEEVISYYANGGYNPWDIYNNDIRVKKILDSLFNGPWTDGRPDRFRSIFDEIMYKNDTYFILKDFDAYVKAQEQIEQKYKDRNNWAKSCLINIATSGYFSSDRTIREYVKDIWHLDPLDTKQQ